MTNAILAWTALLLGLIGLLFAWCGLVSRHGKIDKLSMWYLGFGLPGSELSVMVATLGVAMAAGFWALGVADHPVGRVALALHGVAVLAMGLAVWRARHTFEVLDRGLRQAFGNDYESGIAPSRRSLIKRKLDPARWWRPFAFQQPGVQWIKDIPYVPDAHKQQRLDVMVSGAPAEGPRPVLLNIHGGGWMIGNKGTQAMPLQMHMAANGWLVVDADYRLSPAARMPDHLVDVKAAIAWTRAHAAEYGGDPRFIAITGGSAGGHLTALAALTSNQPAWQPGFESADTRVQLAVPYYGKYDLLGEMALDEGFEEFMARSVMPGPRAQHPELWRAMHPASHAAAVPAAEAAPMLMLHGTNDVLIPLAEARWFAGRMRQDYAGELTTIELPHANHGFDVFQSLRADLAVEAMQRYLELQYARWCQRQGVTPTPAAPVRPA